MGRPRKCVKAGLWRAAISLMMDGAHWGGAPTCWAMAATAWAIAVRSGPMPGCKLLKALLRLFEA